MATQAGIFTPDPTAEGSASLSATTASAAILIGAYRLLRIWADAPIHIKFGPSTVAAPTVSDYAISTVPQDFDMGPSNSYIRLYNGGAGAESYYYQVLSKS